MSAEGTNATIPPEIVAHRRAVHEREVRVHRRWRRAVSWTSWSLAAIYLWLLIFVRVMEPYYLIVNVLAIITGLCNIVVFRVYEVPTILAELPRLSERDRRINLAAIEPERAEMLGDVLPGLGLVRRREHAAAMDDEELVQKLARVQRRNWKRIALVCFVAWWIVVPGVLVWVIVHRPEHGLTLFERLTAPKVEPTGPR